MPRIFDRTVMLFLVVILWTISLNAEAKRQSDEREGETSRQACEGETLNISCPQDRVITIIRANYGRYSQLPCNPSATEWPNVQCTHGKSVDIMMDRCEGKRKCSVQASNEEFGPPDPCPRVNKYLDISYRCKTAPPTTTTPKPTELPTEPPRNVNPEAEKEKVTPGQTDAPNPIDRQPQPETQKPPSTEEPEVEIPNLCPRIMARDVEWPETELGHWSKRPCPNDPQQFGKWFCGANGTWSGESPDLTNCVSQWAKNVEMSSRHIPSEQAALTVARRVKEEVFSKPLYGGDTVVVSNVLETVVIQSNEHLKLRSRAEKKSYSSELGKVLVQTGNYLIHDNNKAAWRDLDRENRIRSANSILDSIEMNADLLGETMRKGEATEIVTGPGHYIVLEVTVVQVQSYVQFPSMSFYDKTVDSVRVPREALTKNGPTQSASVVFASYKDVGEFLPPNPVRKTIGRETHLVQRKIVSKVITAKVAGTRRVDSLGEPVLITMRIEKNENLTNPECVYWDKKLDKFGQWSSKGCEVRMSNETHAVCSCDHLTNFAVLMDVKGLGFSYAHTVVLSFITYVGFVISIVCLFLSILAFCIMRGSSSDRITIHVNLCLCLLIAELVFIFGIPQTQFPMLCSVIAGLLHYFFLAAFAWMLLEGFQLYALLVEVFETENSRKKWFYLFGYGIPAVIVGISVGIDREGYGTERYCWLRTDNYFVLSFVGPVIVVLAANAVLLGMAIVIMCRHSHLSLGYRHCQHRTTIENMGVWLKGAVVLVFLLGLTWGFGILYINDSTVVMAYLFTIFNSLQGLFIFLFHVVLNDKMRKEYRKWVRRNDWLPKCLRDSTLTDYQPANGLQKIPTHSSSHGTASSPLPVSDSTSSGTQSYLWKYLHVNTKEQTEPRYNSSAQLLLGKYGTYDVSHKYDYAYVHGLSESSEEGTATSPLSVDSPGLANFIQMERCHPHRPPPNFPPPKPPIYQEPDVLPEVLVQNLDGRIVFDLGNGPPQNSAPGGFTKRPISAKSSSNSSHSEDSAYSEGSSFGSRNPGPRMTEWRRMQGEQRGDSLWRRDVSTSPDSLLNSSAQQRVSQSPGTLRRARNESEQPKIGILNLPSLSLSAGEEERYSKGGTVLESSILSLPDLSYEVPKSTAERISPSLLSPLPSPSERSEGVGESKEGGGYKRVVNAR